MTCLVGQFSLLDSWILLIVLDAVAFLWISGLFRMFQIFFSEFWNLITWWSQLSQSDRQTDKYTHWRMGLHYWGSCFQSLLELQLQADGLDGWTVGWGWGSSIAVEGSCMTYTDFSSFTLVSIPPPWFKTSNRDGMTKSDLRSLVSLFAAVCSPWPPELQTGYHAGAILDSMYYYSELQRAEWVCVCMSVPMCVCVEEPLAFVMSRVRYY